MQQIDLGRLGMFGVTWATFGFAAICTFVVVIFRTKRPVSVSGFIKHAFPPAGWLTKSTRTDVLMYIISKFIGSTFLGIQLFILVVSSTFVSTLLGKITPPVEPPEISFIAIAGWSFLAFLVRDFSNYLTHIIQHFSPVMWEFHKVHHSATFLNPLTTKRSHPFGDEFDGIVAILLSAIPLGVGQHFVGLNAVEMGILTFNANLIGTIVVLDALRHSHFQISFGRLDRVLLSPQMHQFHHSALREHWDVNFGNKLSIWDWAFGTGYKPRPGESLKLGLGTSEELEYNSIRGAYLGPFVKIVGLVRGKPSFGDPSNPAVSPASFFTRVLWRSPNCGPRPVVGGEQP